MVTCSVVVEVVRSFRCFYVVFTSFFTSFLRHFLRHVLRHVLRHFKPFFMQFFRRFSVVFPIMRTPTINTKRPISIEHFVLSSVDTDVALAPTKVDCYGNHKDHRFCAS